MFSRTPAGLSSEYLFYDVDIVVYCEGSTVDDGSSSFDEVFWKKVFAANGLNVQMKGLGSKSNVISLIPEIDGIKRVAVAMDADYDDFYNDLYDNDNVFYTYRYSWESDIIMMTDMDVAIQIFVNMNDSRDLIAEYKNLVRNIRSKIQRISIIDIKYIRSTQALFDREKPLSIVRKLARWGSPPELDSSKILSKAKSIRHQCVGLNREKMLNIDPYKTFFGKFLLSYFYHWLAYKAVQFQRTRKVSMDAFVAYILNVADFSPNSTPQNAHYTRLCERLTSL